MLRFEPLTLNDRDRLAPYLAARHSRSCETTFANLFIWRTHTDTAIAFAEGFLLIRIREAGETRYLFPLGEGDLRRAIARLEEEEEPLCFCWLEEGERAILEREYPGRFALEENEASAEYLYLRSDLATLAGKKYHGKRNHVAQFLRLCGGTIDYRPLVSEDIPALKQLYEEWSAQSGQDLTDERRAVFDALDHFDELGLRGGVIRRDGAVEAFTAGVPVGEDTFDVIVEKGVDPHSGVYAAINQLFVQNALGGFTYINREDDLGLEGLRAAKLSYHPAFLLKKWTAREVRP